MKARFQSLSKLKLRPIRPCHFLPMHDTYVPSRTDDVVLNAIEKCADILPYNVTGMLSDIKCEHLKT